MQYGWIVIPGYCIFFLFTGDSSVPALAVAVWVFTRHYLVIKVMVNIYTEPEHILPIIWDPKNGYFVSLVWSKPLFLSLFTLLELLQVLWTHRQQHLPTHLPAAVPGHHAGRRPFLQG